MRGLVVPVFGIAADLLREAFARRWFLALFAGITLLLAVLMFGLRLEVVDGALAATRLFDRVVEEGNTLSVKHALQPLFMATAYLIFIGGNLFFTVACADFGPTLLSPGRIEHLLALPVRRWQLLVGTYLGVLTLGALGALYGSGGLILLLGFKAGYWRPELFASAGVAVAAFGALYAGMLLSAVILRSAAGGAAVGLGLFIGGQIASARGAIGDMMEEGPTRWLLLGFLRLLPPIGDLAEGAGAFLTQAPDDAVIRPLLATIAFAAAVLGIAIYLFEGKDF